MRTHIGDHPRDWREGRRLRALALHEQGWSEQMIAEALGVTGGALSQWLKRARVGGKVATAASSRLLDRVTGFWSVHRRSLRMRLTWAG